MTLRTLILMAVVGLMNGCSHRKYTLKELREQQELWAGYGYMQGEYDCSLEHRSQKRFYKNNKDYTDIIFSGLK